MWGSVTVDVAAQTTLSSKHAPPPRQVLERSGVLSEEAGAFFYDQDLKLIDSLADGEVTMPCLFAELSVCPLTELNNTANTANGFRHPPLKKLISFDFKCRQDPAFMSDCSSAKTNRSTRAPIISKHHQGARTLWRISDHTQSRRTFSSLLIAWCKLLSYLYRRVLHPALGTCCAVQQ